MFQNCATPGSDWASRFAISQIALIFCTTILGAIENNEVEHLPPPIFTRGFVKAYAREVGLDPQAFAGTLATPQPHAAAAGDVRAD